MVADIVDPPLMCNGFQFLPHLRPARTPRYADKAGTQITIP